MDTKRTASGLWNALFLIGAVVVAYLIYALAAENRDLKARIAELQGPPPGGLAAGDAIVDAELLSLAGEPGRLAELVEGGGVLAFLTTTCPYCKQTLPTWDRISRAYAERGVPFAGISFHDATLTAAYAQDEGVDWPLWVLANPADGASLEVPSVPFTAIVGPEGTVVRAWLGALDAAAEEALLAALDAELADSHRLLSGSSDRDPGCCEAPTPGTSAGR